MVVKLIAADGFPCCAVCKNSDNNMPLPKNPNPVMQLVHKQGEIAKDVVLMKMQQSLKSGKRISLSFDEYSSLKHKRYLNIYVYQDKDKIIKLGIGSN